MSLFCALQADRVGNSEEKKKTYSGLSRLRVSGIMKLSTVHCPAGLHESVHKKKKNSYLRIAERFRICKIVLLLFSLPWSIPAAAILMDL